MANEIVIQDCGCVSIPEDVASELGMVPGTRLKVYVDSNARSVTLSVLGAKSSALVPALAACPIKA